MMIKVSPINSAEYAKVFSTFAQRSAGDGGLRTWIQSFVDAMTEKVREPVSILSIGPGAGEIDADMIARMKQRFAVGHYHAVEPNADLGRRLRERLAREEVPCTIDERSFDPSFSLEASFDVALMIHSLYYMPDPVKAVQHAASFVKPGGAVVIIHLAPEAVAHLFWVRFVKQYAFVWDTDETHIDHALNSADYPARSRTPGSSTTCLP